MLSREMDLNVTSISYDGDDIVIHHIERYQPSVVVIDESLMLNNSGNLFNRLLDYPRLRVLVLGVKDNRINIYDRKEILVSQSADLISAIRGN